MSKPRVLLAPHWRTTSELFSDSALQSLHDHFDIVWGRDEPVPETVLRESLPTLSAIVATEPVIDQTVLNTAPLLQTVIEVAGAFPSTIDYTACEKHGVEVLSCAPGFRAAVAEMGLAMALGCARGLINEHESFRQGSEHWLEDNAQTDFTLYGQSIGFIGFGQIARELMRLLAPFKPETYAYDPWLSAADVSDYDVQLSNLDEVLQHARCLFVAASPTSDNKALLSARELALLQDHALIVVLSRAHLVDFDALTQEALSGRLRVAVDVFPEEPLAADHPIRQADNVLLSPHRAAAVKRGRQPIGDMVLNDLTSKLRGETDRQLARANAATVAKLAGVGDASQVGAMATTRET